MQLISLGALKRWAIWSLDAKNAFLKADGFERGVYVRAPCEWSFWGDRRVWRPRAPAYGRNGVPAAFHRPLREYLVNSAESLPRLGLRFEASSSDPCLSYVFRKSGEAVGVIATRIDDILGCGEPDLQLEVRRFSGKRFG